MIKLLNLIFKFINILLNFRLFSLFIFIFLGTVIFRYQDFTSEVFKNYALLHFAQLKIFLILDFCILIPIFFFRGKTFSLSEIKFKKIIILIFILHLILYFLNVAIHYLLGPYLLMPDYYIFRVKIFNKFIKFSGLYFKKIIYCKIKLFIYLLIFNVFMLDLFYLFNVKNKKFKFFFIFFFSLIYSYWFLQYLIII